MRRKVRSDSFNCLLTYALAYGMMAPACPHVNTNTRAHAHHAHTEGRIRRNGEKRFKDIANLDLKPGVNRKGHPGKSRAPLPVWAQLC